MIMLFFKRIRGIQKTERLHVDVHTEFYLMSFTAHECSAYKTSLLV